MIKNDPIYCTNCKKIAFRVKSKYINSGDPISISTIKHHDGSDCEPLEPLQCPHCKMNFPYIRLTKNEHIGVLVHAFWGENLSDRFLEALEESNEG